MFVFVRSLYEIRIQTAVTIDLQYTVMFDVRLRTYQSLPQDTGRVRKFLINATFQCTKFEGRSQPSSVERSLVSALTYFSTMCDSCNDKENPTANLMTKNLHNLFTEINILGRVNTHNALVWERENSLVSYELKRARPKFNVWCAVPFEVSCSAWSFQGRIRRIHVLILTLAHYAAYNICDDCPHPKGCPGDIRESDSER
ncbi:hypothetical protein ANN_14111 [Periplaneta americana]|uniref:Uncharacterized protein n=1 Tax=Periplaneta americana TaxID=6978 RepID=A0ABQ8SWW9_PERAM|nr:hypothetical protein ANN_14111 [Periplaneta americana]